MKALVKLSGPNRKVWFLSEDGVNITHIKDNQEIYAFSVAVQSKEQQIDEEVVNLTVENDKVYDIASTATTINITASTGFKYCTLHITTGDSTPTITIPDEWRYTGSDVDENKVFTPTANSEYNIAIDTLGTQTTLYVLKI